MDRDKLYGQAELRAHTAGYEVKLGETVDAYYLAYLNQTHVTCEDEVALQKRITIDLNRENFVRDSDPPAVSFVPPLLAGR